MVVETDVVISEVTVIVVGVPEMDVVVVVVVVIVVGTQVVVVIVVGTRLVVILVSVVVVCTRKLVAKHIRKMSI
jgi:hypothetical protein